MTEGPVDFEVHGADNFYRLSKALKAAGRGDLRRELNKGMRDAAKPLIAQTQAALEEALPPKLKGKGRNTKQQVYVRTGAEPGVSIGIPYGRGAGRGLGASNARMVNRQGLIRHPVFGNREVWANSRVGGMGWFDQTLLRGAPLVRPHLEDAMGRIVDKVVEDAKRGG